MLYVHYTKQDMITWFLQDYKPNRLSLLFVLQFVEFKILQYADDTILKINSLSKSLDVSLNFRLTI